MYNTKIYRYEDSSSYHCFSSPFYDGNELAEIKQLAKQREIDSRKLQLAIMRYYGKDLPDFISEDDFIYNLKIEDFSSYSLWADEKKDKFVNMISSNRSKKAIYDIARSNKWDYFITLTFDRKKIDSTDYDLIIKKVGKWLNNLRRVNENLKYILVPEFHADGCHYHFHGLLANCDNIDFVDSGVKTDNNEIIFNIKNYRMGFSYATKVIDTKRVSS